KPVPIMYKGASIDHIVFDTPWFTVGERMRAVTLAIQKRVFHNIAYEPLSMHRQILLKLERNVGRLKWGMNAYF
ncbi:MAG: hypothetical protein KBA46_07610, partial [Candidatus Omnitrophica bacterium]|nr:hypothetical protein [Candidatus Omnitrophota bacterium]